MAFATSTSFSINANAVAARCARSGSRRAGKPCSRTAARAEGAGYGTVAPAEVKDHLDRGFVIVDIRAPDEVQETGYKSIWELVPLAIMTDDGPLMNPQFLGTVKNKFPNSLSRIIIACDDGTDRSQIAASNLCNKFGYTQLKVLEGGMNAYLAAFPLSEKDLVKWKMSDEDRAGPDTSTLLTGVNTYQGEQFF